LPKYSLAASGGKVTKGMSIDSLLQSAIVAAVVSAIVTPTVYALLGPYRVWREEVARRDLAVRREIGKHLKAFRLRLQREILTRKRLKLGAQIPRGEFLDRDGFYALAWPIVFPLDDPDLSFPVRREIGSLLGRLFGTWRVNYLLEVVEAPTLADPNLGYMALVEGQRHPDAPIDKLLRDGERSAEDVQEVLRDLEEALRIIKGRSLLEKLRHKRSVPSGLLLIS